MLMIYIYQAKGVRFLYIMNTDGVAAAATNPTNRNGLNEADDTKWREKLGAGVAAYHHLNIPRMTPSLPISHPILPILPLNVYNMLISGCCTIAGMKYILGELPEGYKLYYRTRSGGSSHTDYYLYGHVSGLSFDSVPAFLKHVIWLEEGMVAGQCECMRC
jgi:hypothetical protein